MFLRNPTNSVTVLIIHHLPENEDILEMCFKSVLAQDYQGKLDIHIISSSEKDLDPNKFDGATVHMRRDLNKGSLKFNWLLDSDIQTDKVVLVCDDVILSKGCIGGLIDCTNYGHYLVGPFGNNDNGMAYGGEFLFNLSDHQKISIGNNVPKDEAHLIFNEVLSYPRTSSVLLPRRYIPFYCIAMNTEDLKKIGKLDVDLDVRHNDEEFCDRAKKLGIESAINLGAFAVHLGGKTLTKVVSEFELKEATRLYYKKYKNIELTHEQIKNSKGVY